MNKEVNKKVLKVIMEVMCVAIIAIFCYSLTPKTFQNDTFYTIKIGEHIQNTVTDVTKLLPWNEGLYSQDPFSYHENLQYTYPHWLYDLITYKVYSINGFQSVYIMTCALSIILGLSIYFVNRKLNKNIFISALITVASMYCLKDFIAARAQLVTFILFLFTIYGIERFVSTKKLRYAVALVIIPIIIANVHSAVWPFYFVLYLPYFAEYIIVKIVITNWSLKLKKLLLNFKKKKMNLNDYNNQKMQLEKAEQEHNERVQSRLDSTYKLTVNLEKNVKWLALIAVICLFTGLLTPIKDMPYTYLIRTSQGNTTTHISEHIPLTLANSENMITILVIIIGILTFTRTKIKIRDFFMLGGLIALTFITQRQLSMLVLVGNYIVAGMILNLVKKVAKKYFDDNYIFYLQFAFVCALVFVTSAYTIDNLKAKKNSSFVDESFYPVAAANYIKENILPLSAEKEVKLFNDYNYGSYLLFQDIPVFIDSRCDLYSPEFNGKKDEQGKYQGRDIFMDFIRISGLEVDYETEFVKYKITHVITPSNSKLNSALFKDSNYKLLYQDDNFVIYERKSA